MNTVSDSKISKNTLVLGASTKSYRYSNLVIQRLVNLGYQVYAIGKRSGIAHGVEIKEDFEAFDKIHTVTLYLSAERQKEYYANILSLSPKRIIFNPGAENPELKKLARAQGIDAFDACNLVMLSSNTY